MGVRGLKHKRRGCCLRVEEICTSWAREIQDKIGMFSREKNRLEQEARVKGVEGALEPSGDVCVWGGGGGGRSGQKSRIVRQQRAVFFFPVGCEFCIGSRAARDYFCLRAL